MLFELGTFWLMMAFAAVSVFGFMFGSALDSITREDGFGAFGNMLALDAGFFGAIIIANQIGYRLDSLMLGCGVGLAGAFLCFSSLLLIKAGIGRLSG